MVLDPSLHHLAGPPGEPQRDEELFDTGAVDECVRSESRLFEFFRIDERQFKA